MRLGRRRRRARMAKAMRSKSLGSWYSLRAKPGIDLLVPRVPRAHGSILDHAQRRRLKYDHTPTVTETMAAMTPRKPQREESPGSQRKFIP